MAEQFHIVVCGSLVPDPLQTLEPITGPTGPALKNEMMLPSVLDPWAAHALYEAAHLAKACPGSKVWLVSLGPKQRLQQLMMTVAQKAQFEFVAIDGTASGFTDPFETATVLAKGIEGIAGLDRTRLLLFGGCASASRDSGVTMQLLSEMLGIPDLFLAVDDLSIGDDGTLRFAERVEGGNYLISECDGPPAVVGWATGHRPEPPNNPQVGMANMRGIMPALQKAQPVKIGAEGVTFARVELPQQQRQTKIVKDVPVEQIAQEIVEWING
jgi:electron transfer flavoprotein beta subunit